MTAPTFSEEQIQWLTEQMRPLCCFTSGDHDPNHFERKLGVCELQIGNAYRQLRIALGLPCVEDGQPPVEEARSHGRTEGCYWCDRKREDLEAAGIQERGRRELQAESAADRLVRAATARTGKAEGELRLMWLAGTPESHRLHWEDVIVISTAGAREHLGEEDLLAIGRRLDQRDWGVLAHPEEVATNEQNAGRERGLIMGAYRAPDGAEVWAMQHNRITPATIMTQAEH